MAIRDEDFQYEVNNLKETNAWLERKIKNKEEEHEQLERKVAMLRKELRLPIVMSWKRPLISKILVVAY